MTIFHKIIAIHNKKIIPEIGRAPESAVTTKDLLQSATLQIQGSYAALLEVAKTNSMSKYAKQLADINRFIKHLNQMNDSIGKVDGIKLKKLTFSAEYLHKNDLAMIQKVKLISGENEARKLGQLLQELKARSWGKEDIPAWNNQLGFDQFGTVQTTKSGEVIARDHKGTPIKLEPGDILGKIKKDEFSAVSDLISFGQSVIAHLRDEGKDGNTDITHITIIKGDDANGNPLIVDATPIGMITRPIGAGERYIVFKPKPEFRPDAERILKNISPTEPILGDIDVHGSLDVDKLKDSQKPMIEYNFQDFTTLAFMSTKPDEDEFKRFFKYLQYNELGVLSKETDGSHTKFVCSNFCLAILQSAALKNAYLKLMEDKNIAQSIKDSLKLPIANDQYRPEVSDKQIDDWATKMAKSDAINYLLKYIPPELKLKKYISPMELIRIFERYQGTFTPKIK